MHRFKALGMVSFASLLVVPSVALGDEKASPAARPKPIEQLIAPGGELSAPAPYPVLTGGSFSGPAVPESPDPLVRYRWDKTGATDDLQIYYLKPVKVDTNRPDSFENLDSLKGPVANVLVKDVGSIRLDFGVESAAWLEFDSPDLAGQVSMSISEYNEPAIVNAGAKKPVKTDAPKQYGKTYRLELNKELYEGVRFGWIHVGGAEKPWHITNVRLVCQVKPTNYTGSFSCSDPQLTRIWYTGAYGVKLNLLKDYFGAILMERSDRFSWTGDAHTSQAAALVAFSNYDFIRHNIDRTAKDTNDIESYSMYWILSLLDYYWYTGDDETFKKYIPVVEGKLAHALEVYGKTPKLGFYGHDDRIGAAFEYPDCTENQNAYKMLVLQTCLEFARTAGFAGQSDLKIKYTALADERITELRRKKDWYADYGLHASADAINAGFASPEERTAMYLKSFTDPVQTHSYSPFNQYFIIRALAAVRDHDGALAAVRRCWGGQLDLGATSFWEVFRPEWKEFLKPNDAIPNCQCGYVSLCHPWSGGVTKWLHEEILGIRPTLPGFRGYLIQPHLGRVLSRVSGQVQTPQGLIAAAYDAEAGTFEVNSPPGVTGMIGIPKAGRTIKEIRVGDRLIWDGQYHAIPELGGSSFDDLYVFLMISKPGLYKMTILYEGSAPAARAVPPIRYAAKFIKEDVVTAGNWPGKYGREGYVLFGCDKGGKDDVRLPAWVKGLRYPDKIGAPRRIHWTDDTPDPRAAIMPDKSGSRWLGAIATQNPKACFQTTWVAVDLAEKRDYQLALYCADYDHEERRMAVELFDADTNNLIAPTRMLSKFDGGVYLVYHCDSSVRVRINHIRGGDAVLSGLFFDGASNP